MYILIILSKLSCLQNKKSNINSDRMTQYFYTSLIKQFYSICCNLIQLDAYMTINKSKEILLKAIEDNFTTIINQLVFSRKLHFYT